MGEGDFQVSDLRNRIRKFLSFRSIESLAFARVPGQEASASPSVSFEGGSGLLRWSEFDTHWTVIY